jgi:predicted TPR repeat methyltransferase
MKLAIEQALQQAVEAHKAGKLQDAESLYLAILQAQPKHPDANHNLGVLAVSLNKSELALPLFKAALEANSQQVQFWISYIDALINTNQFEIAKSVLEQGKKLGLAGDRVDALEAQLTLIALVEKSESILQKQLSSFTQQRKKMSAKKEKNNNSSSSQKNSKQVQNPSQLELNSLLEQYQKERYDLAENLAKAIIHKYPVHQFSWKVLGAVFQETGRLQESLMANQRAVAISPNDADAHYNLGITLKELGRLEDAETSYNKAIATKPDYAEAHSNLGATLKALGRLEDAEASYNKAIAIKPEYAEAHSNLGTTLKALGRLEDAEASYTKAIAIKPEYAEELSHAIASLKGLNPVRATDAYVSSLFDGYAKKFESSLVGELNYKTPTIIANFLRPLIPSVNPKLDVLDLGCGTGLAGEALIDLAKTLVGIDLSKEMLKIAEAKNIYSRLIQDEIHHALSQEQSNSFDIIVSSDVFVYIGDIKAIFDQVYKVLKVGGFFAYSAEALFPDNNGAAGALLNYKLNPNGRYSHSSKYLLGLIDAKKFILHVLGEAQIRLEKGRPVMGYVVIMQKQA